MGATGLVIVVAALHLYICYLEMAQWTSARARKVFGTTPAFAEESRVLAANQGLYNAFLGMGLLVGLFLGPQGQVLIIYLLGCVAVAGLYGAVTATMSALYTQTIPATLALMAILFGI
jgi:putative membrane protein